MDYGIEECVWLTLDLATEIEIVYQECRHCPTHIAASLRLSADVKCLKMSQLVQGVIILMVFMRSRWFTRGLDQVGPKITPLPPRPQWNRQGYIFLTRHQAPK